MPLRALAAPLDRLPAIADAIARARPEVDAELARELLHEAAIMLDDGLALDDLDDHDTNAVVDGLCAVFADRDPGSALRERAEAVRANPVGLHDPEAVRASYLNAVTILQL
jgi:hypothetical protein